MHGLDGHAHAEDGRLFLMNRSAKAGIIHGHNHDAHIGGPPEGMELDARSWE